MNAPASLPSLLSIVQAIYTHALGEKQRGKSHEEKKEKKKNTSMSSMP
jgi:hypothetical protein